MIVNGTNRNRGIYQDLCIVNVWPITSPPVLGFFFKNRPKLIEL